MKESSSLLDIVTVNEKGQIVIPADARAIADIHYGDKLLLMIHPSKEGIVLIKPDRMESYAKKILSQVNDARDAIKKNTNNE